MARSGRRGCSGANPTASGPPIERRCMVGGARKQKTELPPMDLPAERAILGALMIDGSLIGPVTDTLRPDQFYASKHGELFAAMKAMHERGAAVDFLTVQTELSTLGALESIGGLAELMALCEAVPSTSNTMAYVGIVAQKALLRHILAAARAVETAVTAGADYADVVRLSEALAAAKDGATSSRTIQVKDAMSATWDRIEALQQAGGLAGLATGFRELDEMLAGLQRSDLVILAARPSMGKTALGLNILRNVTRSGHAALLCSLEMPAEAICMRLLATEAGVDAQKIRGGGMDGREWGRLSEAAAALSALPLHIDDSPAATLADVRAKARRLKRDADLRLLVVDYLQIMSAPKTGRGENRQQEIAEMSRGLKALARELDIPVLVLSQLSRGVEGRTSRRPMLSDLRESGAIEQDADVVLFLYRDDYYNAESQTKYQADVTIAKQRSGPTGRVDLYFARDTGRFTALETRRQPAVFAGRDAE